MSKVHTANIFHHLRPWNDLDIKLSRSSLVDRVCFGRHSDSSLSMIPWCIAHKVDECATCGKYVYQVYSSLCQLTRRDLTSKKANPDNDSVLPQGNEEIRKLRRRACTTFIYWLTERPSTSPTVHTQASQANDDTSLPTAVFLSSLPKFGIISLAKMWLKDHSRMYSTFPD